MILGQSEGSTRVSLRGRLPMKITGIVFWGMMLVGMVFSLIQLRGLDDQVMGRVALNADRFIVDLLDHLDRNRGIKQDKLGDQLRALPARA